MSREVYCHRRFPETSWKDFLLVKGWKRAAPDLRRIVQRNPWSAADIAAVGVKQVSNTAAANEGKSEGAPLKLPARGERHRSVTLRGSCQHIWEPRRESRTSASQVTHQLAFSAAQKNANKFQRNKLLRVFLGSSSLRRLQQPLTHSLLLETTVVTRKTRT